MNQDRHQDQDIHQHLDSAGLLPQLQPGEVVDGFVVDGFFAAGGWSDVYRAHHADLVPGAVALKIFPTGLRRPPPYADLAGIPHLVAVHASGTIEDRGFSYVAMELVSGRGLDDHLGLAPPDAQQRRWIVRRCVEVAAALAELHRRGFVHGDVKPTNILIDDDPRRAPSAVLVDLGCARRPGTIAPAATIYATLPYAAPEQLLGLEVDGRADVFALGLCLHDLLSGRRPPDRGARPAAGMEQLDALVPALDADLAAIVAEAADPLPERRYRDAAAMADDLVRWLEGAPPLARPRWPLARARRLLRRQPAVFFRRTTVLAAALAAGVAALTVVQGLLTHVAARSAIANAFAAGDLSYVTQLQQRLSPAWNAIWPTALGDRPEDRESAELVEVLGRDGVDAGRRRAGALLSRDGVDRHPIVGAWLLDRAGRADGLLAAATLSHALYDHPSGSTSDPRVARLRDGLVGVLRESRDTRALHALSALGGLARLEDLEVVESAWLVSAASHSARVEVVRLGFEACVRIASRWRPDGADVSGGLAAILTGYRRAVDWLGRQPDLRVLRSVADHLATCWLLVLRRQHERARRPAPDPSTLLLPWNDSVAHAAAAGDASGVAAMIRAPTVADAYGLGFARALLSEPEELRDCRPDLGVDPAEWRDAYMRGRRAADLARSWPDTGHVVDPGSRLADEGAAEQAMTGRPTRREPDLPAGAFAAWNFIPAAATCSGRAIGVATRAVSIGRDELVEGCQFLRLGAPGVSTVELTFDEPQQVFADRHLALSIQQAKRGALPYGGQAGIEILLDDRRIVTLDDLGNASANWLRVSLPGVHVGRRRTLQVRLKAGSNTTVRLYEARLE